MSRLAPDAYHSNNTAEYVMMSHRLGWHAGRGQPSPLGHVLATSVER